MCTGLCADSLPPVTGIGAGSLAISMGLITVTGGNSPSQYLAPDDLSSTCIPQAINVCDTIIFTTNGLPAQISFSGVEDDACGPTTDTLMCTQASGGCPDSLVISATSCIIIENSMDASCGNSDGQASAAVSGCSGPYTYLWDDPQSQTNAIATGLAAGIYSVTIIDSLAVSYQSTITVNSSGGPVFSITPNDATCKGSMNGSATISVTSGTAPFTYLWSDGSTQSTITALGAGTYAVTVTDSTGCSDSNFTSIDEPALIIGNASIAICVGDSILLGGVYQNIAGNYQDTMIAANGCDSVLSISLTVDTLPIVTFTGLENIYCQDGELDTLEGFPSGGTFIGAGMSGNILNPSVQNYTAGSHSITYTYTDNNGCTDSSNQSFQVVYCLGVEEGDISSRRMIHPNPNSGKFVIKLNGISSSDLLDILVFNALGKKIKAIITLRSNNIDVELNAAPPGIYFLKLKLGDYKVVQKLVVQ